MGKLLTLLHRGGFSPTDIDGLAIWLDAYDPSTITLSGSNISQWNDKSENSNHAAQGNAVNQPIYLENGLNGRPSVQFLGDQLVITDNASLDYTTCHAFIVAERNVDNGSVNYMLWKWATNEQELNIAFFNNGAPDIVRGYISNDGTSVHVMETGYTPALGEAIITDLSFDGAECTTTVNNQYGASVSQTIRNGSANMIVGHSTTGEQRISEILFYTQPLNMTQRLQILNYLSNKWGIVL